MKLEFSTKKIDDFLKKFDFSIHIGNRKLDTLSIYLFIIASLVWHMLWKLGQFDKLNNPIFNYLYYFSYFILFFNTLLSDDTRFEYEDEEKIIDTLYRNIQPMSTATLALGAFIINSTKYRNIKTIKTALSSLKYAFFSAFLGLIYITIPKYGPSFKFIIKAKQSLLNFGIIYFMMTIYLITSTDIPK